MNRIEKIQNERSELLKEISKKHNVQFSSLLKLIKAENVKKLLKRRAFMQSEISKEIKKIAHDN